jgi:hypothetical protein
MRKNRKRHTGCLVTLLIFVIIAVGLLLGGRTLLNSIKVKAAKTLAKKVITEQIEQNIGSLGNIDVDKIIDDMPDEDVNKITDMVDKYVGLENIGEYINMARDGELNQLQQYLDEKVSQEDKEEIQSLYNKYKDKYEDQIND